MLAINIIYFLVGLCISIIPIIIYFSVQNAISDMLYGTFFNSIQYNSKPLQKVIRAWIHRIPEFIPIVLLVYYSFYFDRKNKTFFYPLMFCIAIISFFALGNNNFEHYFIVWIPLYCLAFGFILEEKQKIVLLVVLGLNLINIKSNFISRMNDIRNYKNILTYNSELKTMYNMVPVNEQKNIWAFTAFHGMGFYTVNNILPPNKYFVGWFIGNNPTDSLSNEKIKEFLNEEPSWVLVEKNENNEDKFDYLLKNYKVVDYIDARKHPDIGFELFLYKQK